MPTKCIYTYRRALNSALGDLLVSALPALNAALTETFGSSAPQFAASDVVVGERYQCEGPTLCVVSTGSERGNSPMRRFHRRFYTQIHAKTPRCADNTPEAFDAFVTICTDTINDLLTSATNRVITPKDDSGNPNLPQIIPPNTPYQSFYNCEAYGDRPMALPVMADGKTRTRGVIISHIATLDYSLDRPDPVGG